MDQHTIELIPGLHSDGELGTYYWKRDGVTQKCPFNDGERCGSWCPLFVLWSDHKCIRLYCSAGCCAYDIKPEIKAQSAEGVTDGR